MTQPNNAESQGFGKWLRFTREARGMNQTELADLIGRTQPTISKLEEGGLAPSSAICIQFAQVFDVPVDIVLAKASLMDEASAPPEARTLSKESLDVALRIDRLPAIEHERVLESVVSLLDTVERRLGKGKTRMSPAHKRPDEAGAYSKDQLFAIA